MRRSIGGAVEGSKPGSSDFLQLDRLLAPSGELATWLTEHLRTAIADGWVPVGSALPSTRVLAADLGVSRGVVTEAYQRLTEEGQVAGSGRRGTVVLATPAPVSAPPPEPDRPNPFAGPADNGAVFDRLRRAPARIDLSPGVPDLAAFPRAAWLRAERTVLSGLSTNDLRYGDPHGTVSLRRAVSAWLARNRGIRADPADIIILAGVAQALTLLTQVLRGHGIDQVAVEDPGSLGTRQQFQAGGLATPPIAVDDDGIRVDALEASGARAVMVTPAHQFPTGVVLEGERRRRLLGWADDGGLIIEDDYDAEHRYDRPPVPALRSSRADVCYTASVSKLLAPALRIGWLLAPARLRDELVAAKRTADLGNAALPQLVLAELMGSGAMERHLRMLRVRHRRRRDAMTDAIRRHLPNARVHGAAAGLHLTVTFKSRMDDVAIAAAALDRGVKVQPLSWHRQLPGPSGLVLGYAACGSNDIEAGIATLRAVIRRGRG